MNQESLDPGIGGMKTWQQALVAAGLIVLVLVLGWISGQLGSTDTDWFRSLNKPDFQPPDWVFGPTWSLLYVLMALAAFFVLRMGLDAPGVLPALILFDVQLLLNLAWSPVFFGLQTVAGGLVVILVLVVFLVLTVWRFFRLSRLAGWLMVPYLLWTTFATVLTATIFAIN